MSAPAGGSSLSSGPVGSSGSAGGKLGAPLLARFAAILAGQGATGNGGEGTGRFASFQTQAAALDDGAPAAAPAVGAGNVNQTNGGWFGGWANPLNWRRVRKKGVRNHCLIFPFVPRADDEKHRKNGPRPAL